MTNKEEKSLTFQIPNTELSSSEDEKSGKKNDKLNLTKTERRYFH